MILVEQIFKQVEDRYGNVKLTSPLWKILPVLGLFLFSSCSQSSTSPVGRGEVRFMMVDSPAGFDPIHLVLATIEVHNAGDDSTAGWIRVIDTTIEFDLLSWTDGASNIVGHAFLPIGHYDRIRVGFGVGNSIVVLGQTHSLDVPSMIDPTIDHVFTIEEDRLCGLTLGLDAAKSVMKDTDGRFILHPNLRVIANDAAGAISGTVGPAGMWATITAVGADADTVSITSDSTDGSFLLAALPAGSYNLTFEPGRGNYLRTMVSGVQVSAQKDKKVGTIILSERP